MHLGGRSELTGTGACHGEIAAVLGRYCQAPISHFFYDADVRSAASNEEL